MFAGQPEPEVVLGQQNPCQTFANLGFVPRDPKDLWRSETRKDDVARQAAKHRIAVKLRGLFVGARVVPKDAGAQHLVARIQKRRAMHLPGKPDAADPGKPMRRKAVKHGFGSGDPVRRRLFAPAFVRAGHGQRRGGLCDHLLRFRHQDTLEARGPQIEPNIHLRHPGVA